MSKYRDNLNTGLNIQQSWKLAQIAKTAQQTKEIEQERLKIEEKRLEEEQRRTKEQQDRENESERRRLLEEMRQSRLEEERERAIILERTRKEQEEKFIKSEKYMQTDPYLLFCYVITKGNIADFNELNPIRYPSRVEIIEILTKLKEE